MDLCRSDPTTLGRDQISWLDTPPIAAAILPLQFAGRRIVCMTVSRSRFKTHTPQAMTNKWSQSCNATGGNTDAGLDSTPDSNVGSRIQEVRTIRKRVYVEHANDGCGATNGSKGQDTSNERFRLQFHLQVPDNEERESAECPICGSIHSCKSVRDAFRRSSRYALLCCWVSVPKFRHFCEVSDQLRNFIKGGQDPPGIHWNITKKK